jgi:hypothetical protein
MNPFEALEASGHKPIYIDEDTDIEQAVLGRHETNTEFITRIMEFGCPTGALIQPFVIEALRSYAERYAVNPIPENNFINPEAWMETAQWALAELEKKYG